VKTGWQRAGTVRLDLATCTTAVLELGAPLVEPSTVPRPSFCPDVGTLIAGVYRIEGTLATGGMGIVTLARDEQLERQVAIKFVRPELLEHSGFRARFLAEARAMASVRHPNVLNIYAYGEHRGAPYFVMEFVLGQTVEHWLQSTQKPFDVTLALRFIDDTCKGVSAIHAAGTVHRDIKPSNLLLDAQHNLRVSDFGVSDLLQRPVCDNEERVVGTPEYMAPEVVLGAEIPSELAYRADVYSLGCLAFELLTGGPPFPRDSARGRMLAHVIEDPPPPSAVRPELGTDFDEAVLAALTKDPKQRTATVERFRRAMLTAQDKGLEPVRILVADDDADFRELLLATLTREFPEAEIQCVWDGNQALQAFDERHHSVAIIDLEMPGLDGIELTRRLRARDGARSVPIVVITGNGSGTEWKQLSALGADGFLVKPVNVRDLVQLVRRAIGDHRGVPGSQPPSIR
jgi:eukaryotic-like serine/threonine-protein kinase